jgi:hypothetical protein
MRKRIGVLEKSLSRVRLDPSIKKKINKKLNDNFSYNYFSSIPLKDIFNVLKGYRIVVVDEAGEQWSGFLTGSSGRAYLDLVLVDEITGEFRVISNSILSLSWYKMPSGRYEITLYLS